MKEDFIEINTCRLCKNTSIEKLYDFGEVPLPNAYLSNQNELEKTFPLTLIKCNFCHHVQLNTIVNPKLLFSDYLYSSSYSGGLVKHFKNFAKEISEKLQLKKDDLIIDIGANDGITLKEFQKLGFTNLLGIEPASNITEKLKDITIINDFFDDNLSNKIKEKYGTAKLIICCNCYAHLADIDGVTKGIKNLMDKDSIFIFENAYLLETIKNLYFDQIYLEHLDYHSVTPLVNYFYKNEMELFDISENNIQGGTIRGFVRLNKNTGLSENIQKYVNKEFECGLFNLRTYSIFFEKLQIIRINLRNILIDKINRKKTISCYGCPAKFVLFSKFFNLDNNIIKYVVDESPLKIGKFSPGQKIPIVSKQHFIDNPTDVCIISAWNFENEIKENNKQYKGLWLNPFRLQ